MCKVYILKSLKTGQFYVGMTNNIYRRVRQHNRGLSRSTKAHRPWVLFYYEDCEDRFKARAREKFYKSGYMREKRKNVVG